MTERAGTGNGQGASPCPGLPGREPHLAGFTAGGEWDSCPPSASLAQALEGASGAGWRCPGATRDEMLGLLRQWQALEAHAAAGKLGVLRALIREDDQPLPGGGYSGDLPQGWTKSLTHEVALALSMPVVSADKLMWLAWDLEGRLPGIGRLLASGELTCGKVRGITDALVALSADDARAAEALILPGLPGKTYGQAVKLATQAAVTVDPESEARRRRHAEQESCRVQMFREQSGAAALSGRDLPTDQTLTAFASVCARAQEYAESGVFAEGTRMDQYRASAYLDLLNGVTSHERISLGVLAGRRPGDEPPADDSECGDDPGGDGPAGGSGDGQSDPGDQVPPTAPPRMSDLVIPLATLLGLAERPGEGHGLGPLDPGLSRYLAAAAIASPHTRLCVTVTDPDGIAIGHGCARSSRRGQAPASSDPPLPARVNLTVTTNRLAELTRATGPPGARPWNFTRDDDTDVSGGHGTWMLTLPDGRILSVALRPAPTFECGHQYESHAYQPNDTLRHMVQVRDGECTFPTCSRHARESDFEHAIPYEKGGMTCACNAGARSRACHQVKQSPGWKVTQPRPGWHQWETPSGRVYVQGPKRYPV